MKGIGVLTRRCRVDVPVEELARGVRADTDAERRDRVDAVHIGREATVVSLSQEDQDASGRRIQLC